MFLIRQQQLTDGRESSAVLLLLIELGASLVLSTGSALLEPGTEQKRLCLSVISKRFVILIFVLASSETSGGKTYLVQVFLD